MDGSPLDPTTGTVRGEEFTAEEMREYRDFADLMRSYGVCPEMLKDFVGERPLKVGHCLFLALHLPVDDLGIALLAEDDRRVTRIAKARCEEARLEETGGIIV